MNMMTKSLETQRIDPEFSRNLKRLYPGLSHKKATKELNKVLEKMLFGIK